MHTAAETMLKDMEGQAQPIIHLPPRPEIRKVRYTHDAMIDMLIAEPEISQNTLAARFGFTPPWISIVINSDAFRARLAQRKVEIVDPILVATVNEKFRAVTHRSLEILAEKLSKPSETVSDQLVLRAAELGAKALGIGGNAPIIHVDPIEHLDKLAQRLVQLQKTTRELNVIEGECDETNIQEAGKDGASAESTN